MIWVWYVWKSKTRHWNLAKFTNYIHSTLFLVYIIVLGSIDYRIQGPMQLLHTEADNVVLSLCRPAARLTDVYLDSISTLLLHSCLDLLISCFKLCWSPSSIAVHSAQIKCHSMLRWPLIVLRQLRYLYMLLMTLLVKCHSKLVLYCWFKLKLMSKVWWDKSSHSPQFVLVINTDCGCLVTL